MPQSFHVDLGLVERGEGRRLEGTQASHDLLDMMHAHGKVEPVQDGLHRAACGRAHQRRQRGVAVRTNGVQNISLALYANAVSFNQLLALGTA